MSGYHLPDELRERAVVLYEEGRGYKSIARELGLSRDLVRDWIQAYRTKGRKCYVHKNRAGNALFESFRASLKESFPQTLSPENSPEALPLETELEKRMRRHQERIDAKENRYREAREAYEQGESSLLKVAEQFGVSYGPFREFIQRYHPESKIIHTYNRNRKELSEEIDAQIARVRAAGDRALASLTDEMEREMAKVKRRI